MHPKRRTKMSQFCLQERFKLFSYLYCTLGIVVSQDVNNYPSGGSTASSLGSSSFYYQQAEYPKDCNEARNQCSTNSLSDVQLIRPDGYPEPFEVYCDNTVDSGGWTVINRRRDGSLLFNRNWTEYKSGFGFLSQEFWIGHDKLSYLTNQDTYQLRIDLTGADGLTFSVTYNRFRISDEYSEYKLTSVGQYNGSEDNINRFLCPLSDESGSYIPPDCSRRCSCISGQFTCDGTYVCDLNAVCEDRSNGSQCYCNAGYKGDGITCTIDIPPSDCQDVHDRGSILSGVYKIKPTTWLGESFDVYCNMTDGEGWTRRVDGSQDFHLYWSDYKAGFGTPDIELWLGNDKLHSLTTQKAYQLRIDFVNGLVHPYYASYDSFSIRDESDNYRLTIGTHSGTAGNDMVHNNGKVFTTRDRDNDDHADNCATHSNYGYFCNSGCATTGGWWYSYCGTVFLNGPYGTNCFHWYHLPGNRCNIKYTEMKLKPV